MPIIANENHTVLAAESMSTHAAANVLAAETRAFSNAAAKLRLKMATDSFVRARQELLQKLANDKIAHEQK